MKFFSNKLKKGQYDIFKIPDVGQVHCPIDFYPNNQHYLHYCNRLPRLLGTAAVLLFSEKYYIGIKYFGSHSVNMDKRHFKFEDI